MSHEQPHDTPEELPDHLQFVSDVFETKLNTSDEETVQDMVTSIQTEATFAEIARLACEPNDNDPDSWKTFGRPINPKKEKEIQEQLDLVNKLYEESQNENN